MISTTRPDCRFPGVTHADQAATTLSRAWRAWRALPDGPLQDEVRQLQVQFRADAIRLQAIEQSPPPFPDARRAVLEAIRALQLAMADNDFVAVAAMADDLRELTLSLCHGAARASASEAPKPEEAA